MASDEPTRRDVLRTGSGLLAAGTVASTAGCISSLPFLGGGALNPKKWAGAPGTYGDSDHGLYIYTKPKALLDNEDKLASSYADGLDKENDRHEMTGLDPADVEVDLSPGPSIFSPSKVWKADFNEDDVTGELEDNDLSEEGDHEGFTVYVADEESDYSGQAVGVTGDKLVFGRKTEEMDAQDVVETAIDVGNGNEDRFADENEHAKTVMNEAGTEHYVFGRTQEAPDETNTDEGTFKDNVAEGISWTVNGDSSDLQSIYVFEDDDAADKDDVEDFVDNRKDKDGLISKADETNVNKDGNTIVVKITVDTDEVFADDGE